MINEKALSFELPYQNPQFQIGKLIEDNPHIIKPCSKFIPVQKVTFYGICRNVNKRGVF